MADPVNTALYGFRTMVFMKNTTTGSEVVVDRVQSIEPSFNAQTDAYYELGRKGKIGSTQAPPEFTINLSQNMTDSMEFEFLCAGLVPSPGGAQNYNLGQLLTVANNLQANALLRNNDETILGEQQYDGLSFASITYNWQVNGAMTQDFSFVGRQGRFYTSGSAPHAWGALDDVSLGGIHGKDARIYFSSGSAAGDQAFRLQSFSIRVTFPTTMVREIGRRSIVGTLSDSPDVTIDFEILEADTQPTEVFYQLAAGAYDYTNPTVAFDARVRVFDPRLTEALSVLKMFKIENVLPVSHTPIRSQVRGLSTARYSLTMSKEQTADTGGLIVSNRNDL